jgi:hypothetical protein
MYSLEERINVLFFLAISAFEDEESVQFQQKSVPFRAFACIIAGLFKGQHSLFS